MRIGIDATALPLQPVGAGNYIIQLIRALVTLNTGADWFIFVQSSRVDLLKLSKDPHVHLIIQSDSSRPFRLIWEQTILPLTAKRLHLDVLHSLHYTMPLAASCPVVVTIHDMTFFLLPQLHIPSKRWYFRTFIRLSARRAALLAAVSESTRQDAIRLIGVPPTRIMTTPLGITDCYRPVRDVDVLSAVREKYHLPPHFILNVGLLEPRKNLPGLLRAFARIAPQFPSHQLTLVGRLGWQVDEIFRQADELNLHDRVHFTGYVDEADLPAVYSLADIFVYPTFYEGFGLPVLEAMACGVPVITSNTSSLPEIAGDAAVLISPTDDQQLAEAMSALLADPQAAQRLGQAARQRSKNFTWERTARLTYALYQQVAAAKA